MPCTSVAREHDQDERLEHPDLAVADDVIHQVAGGTGQDEPGEAVHQHEEQAEREKIAAGTNQFLQQRKGATQMGGGFAFGFGGGHLFLGYNGPRTVPYAALFSLGFRPGWRFTRRLFIVVSSVEFVKAMTAGTAAKGVHRKQQVQDHVPGGLGIRIADVSGTAFRATHRLFRLHLLAHRKLKPAFFQSVYREPRVYITLNCSHYSWHCMQGYRKIAGVAASDGPGFGAGRLTSHQNRGQVRMAASRGGGRRRRARRYNFRHETVACLSHSRFRRLAPAGAGTLGRHLDHGRVAGAGAGAGGRAG